MNKDLFSKSKIIFIVIIITISSMTFIKEKNISCKIYEEDNNDKILRKYLGNDIYEEGDLRYEEDNDDKILRKYLGNDNEVIIPDKITGIFGAFYNNKTLEKVTIPNSVNYIGSCSFTNCTNLTTIEIPNSVIKIGEDAFRGCKNLSEIQIPKTVTEIEKHAFDDTAWLKQKQKKNEFVIVNDILIDGKTCKGEVNIPKEVKFIGNAAFSYIGDHKKNEAITSINIPNSVTEIRNEAFYDCINIENIDIPNSVTSIGEDTFYGCINLKSINLPNKLEIIKLGLFEGCINLEKVNIPASVKEIETVSFKNCKKLKALTIPSTVKELDLRCFFHCKKLRFLTLSDKTIIKDFLNFNKGHKNCTIYYSTNKSNAKKYAEEHNLKSEKIALTKTDLNLSVGEKAKLELNSQSLCEWKSSDKNIATVSKNGKVTAKSKGETIITAILYDIEYNCKVVVE